MYPQMYTALSHDLAIQIEAPVLSITLIYLSPCPHSTAKHPSNATLSVYQH